MSDEWSANPAPGKKRWQFSVRALLLVTAVVAGVLAVAAQSPTVFQVASFAIVFWCLLAGLRWVANRVPSHWQPLLTVVSWAAFGLSFIALGGWMYYDWAEFDPLYRPDRPDPVQRILCLVMTTCALVCFYRAGGAIVRWRRARRAEPNDVDSP